MPHTKSDPLDDTDHGPVPNLQPNPVAPERGREPLPNEDKPGDGVDVPPSRAPFPEKAPDQPLGDDER